MEIIDAHVHFWEIDQGNQPWLTNPRPNLLGDYSPIARDYGPTELRADAEGLSLGGAVHIEADAVDPCAETRWLVEHTDESITPVLPSAIVVGADLSRRDAIQTIEAQMAMTPRVRGVRQILNVHADPLFDYVGRDYMAEPAWRANFAGLAALGLSFDLQLYPAQMGQAAKLAAAHPQIRIVLNHAGMYVDRHSVTGWRQWRDGLRALATQENVAIKLSGFGMLDHRWTPDSIRPLILEAIDAFGSDRCLFASNYPVDSLYARYTDIWAAYADVVADASTDEKQALFADNARHFYRLPTAEES